MSINTNFISNDLKEKLIEHLSNFVLEKRLELFHTVLAERTRYLTVVLEDIYQSQNASAVIRSCECFGIQDIHIIENLHKFNINPKVSLGAAKWLDIKKYNQNESNSLNAIANLKKKGYRIVGTSPHVYNATLENFNLSEGKFALFIGNELNGLSDIVLNNADELIQIQTVGFTESLNLSVSAAICLYQLTTRMRRSEIDYQLTTCEGQDVLLDWLRKSIKSWKSIEKRFIIEYSISEKYN